MQTDPAPLSPDGAELPLISGPAVSRPTEPQPLPESSARELAPPFVSPLRSGTGSPADSGEDSQVQGASGDADLAWLSAIDWGDDHGAATESAVETEAQPSADAEGATGTEAPARDTSEQEVTAAEEDVTEVIVEELVGEPPAPAAASHDSEPAWIAWVNDEADPVDPTVADTEDRDSAAADTAAVASAIDSEIEAPAEEELPIVEIDTLLESGTEERVAEAAAEPATAAALDAGLEELADRLERIAATLRSRSLADVAAGAGSSDPLEILLAGYALGYARARSTTTDEPA